MRCPPALLLTIAIGLTACGSSSASPSPATSTATPAKAVSCGPRSARTLASSRRARVYVQKQVVYGCSAGHRRVLRLGELGPCRLAACVALVHVAGDAVAYASVHRGVDTGSSDVVVRRL